MPIGNISLDYAFFSSIILLTDLVIRIGLSLRVIMRKRPYGISLAWLVVILLVPFLGSFFYILVGENRIPEKRVEGAEKSYHHYQHWLKTLRQRAPVNWQNISPECIPLHRQAESLVGLPAMAGNSLVLIDSPEEILGSIEDAINGAESTCHLQFYILEEGGKVDRIIEALINAARRGVVCRVLLDSIGSSDFFKSSVAEKMRAAGIRIHESLPAGIIKALFSRIDIRNHRKIVVIDGKIAFTGSQNMVDPAYFKKDAGVGKWIDLMVKVEGPVVETLAATFIADWYLDTDSENFRSGSILEDIETIRQRGDVQPQPIAGDIALQLVPSGPGMLFPEAIHSLLLTTIYAARKELVLTTPYFIPDEPLLLALKSAAQRGVAVKIIVPKKNDSLLVKYASRARYEELADAGIDIYLFTGGLLHSKTITVDNSFSLLGSVNLDMRSFWLNFEATLFVYCQSFTGKLVKIQEYYLVESEKLDIKQFSQRGKLEKLKENTMLLVSPLL